jgi:hypothetical protein
VALNHVATSTPVFTQTNVAPTVPVETSGWRSDIGADLDITSSYGERLATTTTGTAAAVADPGYAPGDTALLCTTTTDDAPTFGTSSVAAAGATFSALTELADLGSALGDDNHVAIHSGVCTTGPSTAPPSFTATTSSGAGSRGGTVFLRLRETGGTPPAQSTSSGTLTTGSSTADANAFFTDTIYPAGNALLLCTVVVGSVGATGVAPVVTGVAGCGLTWELADRTDVTTGSRNTHVFRALGASPTAGSLTISLADVVGSIIWTVEQFTGVDTSGTNGAGAVVQTVNAKPASTTSVSVAFPATPTAGNRLYAAIGGVSATPPTPGSGWALGVNVAQTVPPLTLWTETATADPLPTAITGTWTTASTHFDVGVEIKTATGGGPPPAKTGAATGGWAFTGTATGTRPAVAPRAGTATGSWTFAGTATGTRPTVAPRTGTATGAWTFTGTATGRRPAAGTATGTWVFAGAATGTRPAVAPRAGTASGGWAFTGAAAGSTTPKGVTTGAWAFTGTAAGTRTPKATAAGSWAFLGAATGTRPRRGTAAGLLGWAGTATGVTSRRGSSSGGWAFTGTAAGRTDRRGTTTGILAWAGTAIGTTPVVGARTGSARGEFVFTGTATGRRTPRGATAGLLAFTGTATGTAPGIATRTGTATGLLAWAGTSTGTTTRRGSATGSWQITGTATGRSTPRGSTSGGWVFTGIAVGWSPSLGSKTGVALGRLSFTGTATGRRAPRGGATGTWAFTGTTRGRKPARGTTTGAFAFTGTATGTAPVVPTRRGGATGRWAFTGIARGSRITTGTATGAATWAGTATGRQPSPFREVTVTIGRIRTRTLTADPAWRTLTGTVRTRTLTVDLREEP